MLIPEMKDLALLIVRVVFGVIFVSHGWTKFSSPAKWSQGLGYPTFIGFLVGCGEFLGGLGVLFGTLTQIAAFGPLIVMLGALYHHIFKWKQKFAEWELPLMLLAVAFALILLGAGAYSIDAYIGLNP